MKHFAEEVVESVAHVDGRVGASFRKLLLEPGRLVADFLAGRRKTQMGPVQLFVVCNVIYFLLQPFSFFFPFTSTLAMQTQNRPWRTLATAMVDAKLAVRHVSLEEYAAHYDETAHTQGKTLVLFMAPIFALGVWALYARVRRFYAEHLVFSLYTWAFVLLWIGVSTVAMSRLYLVGYRLQWWRDSSVLDTMSLPVLVLPFVAYVFLSVRCVYRESWPSALAKTMLLTAWAFATLTAYRFILFFTTFYAT